LSRCYLDVWAAWPLSVDRLTDSGLAPWAGFSGAAHARPGGQAAGAGLGLRAPGQTECVGLPVKGSGSAPGTWTARLRQAGVRTIVGSRGAHGERAWGTGGRETEGPQGERDCVAVPTSKQSAPQRVAHRLRSGDAATQSAIVFPFLGHVINNTFWYHTTLYNIAGFHVLYNRYTYNRVYIGNM
jgi:hypothetical protein